MTTLKIPVELIDIKEGYRPEYHTLVFEPVHINYIDPSDKNRRYEVTLVPNHSIHAYEVGERYMFTLSKEEE